MIIERSLQEIGKSLLVTVPKDWAKSLRLKKGSKVRMVVAEGGKLMIAPELTKNEHRMQATIPLDEHFPRRFFREYFAGAEKITMTKGGSAQRANDFLKRFMNVQVIEETPQNIVVKCLTIDDLSIEECLKRMHFLSLNMFDKMMDKNARTELELSLTRFYYMLVMQVRRFVGEGKFAGENAIPLIRALDFRMAAEKIERIADILKGDKTDSTPLDRIKSFYAHAFSVFINSEYDKALLLWSEERKLRADVDALLKKARDKKAFDEYDSLQSCAQILRYAKEISSLTR